MNTPENVQAVVCPSCSTLNYKNANFCNGCGRNLSSTAVSTTVNNGATTVSAPVNNSSNTYNATHSQTNMSSNANSVSPTPAYTNASYSQETDINSLLDDPDFNALLGAKNRDYYLSKFRMMTATSQISWNWSAFLLGIFWGIYRRLYKQVAICFALAFIAVIAPPLMFLINISISLVWGMYGTSWYKDSLIDKTRQVKSISEPYRTQFIESNKGPLFNL